MLKILIISVCLLVGFCAWLYFYSPPPRMAKPSFDEQYPLQQIEEAVKVSHGFGFIGFRAGGISQVTARSRAEVFLKSYYQKLFPPPATFFQQRRYIKGDAEFLVTAESDGSKITRIYLTASTNSSPAATLWQELFSKQYPNAPIESAFSPDPLPDASPTR
jgi:hypothetical protein